MKGYTKETRSNGRWQRLAVAGTLALSMLWSMPAMAAPALQDEPTPLNLGQMATGTLTTGESAAFSFEAPQDTTYVFTTGDADEAQKFDLVVRDDDGVEVYNDIFETVQLDLDDGDYTAELVAVEDGEFSIFITGQLGNLSENSSRPGRIFNGSFVTVEETGGDQYATLDIADTDFWQQVFVIMSGGDGDDYSATVADADYNTYESVSSTLDEGPLRFFTRGGQYDLSITPAQDGPLTVVILTSGPAPTINLGESLDDAVSAPSGEKYYVVQPSEAGRIVTVTLASDSEDIDLDLAVSTVPGDTSNVSSQFGSDESVTYLTTSEAPIYIRVYAYDASSVTEDVPFTLLAEEGEAAATIEANEAVDGTVVAGTTDYRLFTLPEGNRFVAVVLYAGDADLDLSATVADETGANVNTLYSSNSGGAEIIADYAETPTTWQIKIVGNYVSKDTPYTLLVSVLDPEDIAASATVTATDTETATAEVTESTGVTETTEGSSDQAVLAQWAIAAVASSQYGEDGFSATQVTGEPNVDEALDDSNAWAPSSQEEGEVTLDLTFEEPVIPAAIDIYESYNPGAVVRVAALDPNSNEWIVLWDGVDATGQAMRTFSPELTVPDFATDQIRLTVDTDLVPGWNEIDAVQLFGIPAE